MSKRERIISIARDTIRTEGEAVARLAGFVDGEFAAAVEYVFGSEGRVIVTGIGKSANIGAKIVATLNSTGTPAAFMHAADAIHGDLGTIKAEDVVICLSKSGNTPEIKALAPLIKAMGNKLIAITGNKSSALAKQADYVLNAHVEKEACPNNLAPTSSATAQLVVGDAFAMSLLDLRGFSSRDFARYHPGGSLGKQLYLRVKDLADKNQKPVIAPDATVKEVIVEISEKMLGVAAVIDKGEIAGIITDGDLRRMLAHTDDIRTLKAADIMTANPRLIAYDAMAIKAMELMEANSISQLLVEDHGMYKGVIHIHDLIREGII